MVVMRVGVAAIGVAAIAIMVAYSSSSITQTEGDKHNRPNTAAMASAIVGVASAYNPYRPGLRSGGTETASGETYDPTAWTAAIQTDLREVFGGVHYGKDYRPTFALVASIDKQAIIKINDVGSLEPGRVIDFNEQTMRYFNPTLDPGLIQSIEVIPLLGDDWSPGPIKRLISLADRSDTRVGDPMLKIIGKFEAGLKKYSPIHFSTPDPYAPPVVQ